MNERGIMYTALHRFYGALQNLEKFSLENNLIDNIVNLDNFFSAFRSTSFVLQASVAHTDFKPLYEEMRDKYLQGNAICKWMVDTRNEIEKQHPFDLNKQVFVTVYSPASAEILKSEVFTIDNDVEYISLVESLKEFLLKLNPIEVHFSLEFKFTKADDNTDLYGDISSAISIMKRFLMDMYDKIGETTELCNELKDKIFEIEARLSKSELIFIDDYVYYGEDDRFERGERIIPLLPEEPIKVRDMSKVFGSQYPSDDPKEFMKVIARSHLVLFKKQKSHLMPVLFVVYRNNICRIISFEASIRTTIYRKINEIASNVISGNIKYVTLVHEGYLYNSFAYHSLPYDKRINHSTGTSIMVEQVGDGFVPRCMIFDTAKISDRQYVDDIIKNKSDIRLIIEMSVLSPIYNEIMEMRKLRKTE